MNHFAILVGVLCTINSENKFPYMVIFCDHAVAIEYDGISVVCSVKPMTSCVLGGELNLIIKAMCLNSNLVISYYSKRGLSG